LANKNCKYIEILFLIFYFCFIHLEIWVAWLFEHPVLFILKFELRDFSNILCYLSWNLSCVTFRKPCVIHLEIWVAWLFEYPVLFILKFELRDFSNILCYSSWNPYRFTDGEQRFSVPWHSEFACMQCRLYANPFKPEYDVIWLISLPWLTYLYKGQYVSFSRPQSSPHGVV
jgi:hypothetical protein